MRTALGNLDIVLTSTVEYPVSGDIINKGETSILHHPEASELQHSNYESDRYPTRHEVDGFPAHESDSQILDDSISWVPG